MGNGIYSPYGTSKKYYALCYKGSKCSTTESVMMYQCAKGTEFDRSPSVSKCVFKCPSEGKFEYSLDRTKYFNCVKGFDGKIKAKIETCLPGVFLSKGKYCGFDETKKLSLFWKNKKNLMNN